MASSQVVWCSATPLVLALLLLCTGAARAAHDCSRIVGCSACEYELDKSGLARLACKSCSAPAYGLVTRSNATACGKLLRPEQRGPGQTTAGAEKMPRPFPVKLTCFPRHPGNLFTSAAPVSDPADLSDCADGFYSRLANSTRLGRCESAADAGGVATGGAINASGNALFVCKANSAPGENGTSCLCDAGYRVSVGGRAPACVVCEGATYTNAPNARHACKSCPSGQSSNADHTDCGAYVAAHPQKHWQGRALSRK
jgi:hypothetical protein